MSAIPSRGLTPAAAGLLRPSEPPAVELPAVQVETLPAQDEAGETVKRRRRRVAGVKTLKVTAPAALIERVVLAAMMKGVKPSLYLADLLERNVPKLGIRRMD